MNIGIFPGTFDPVHKGHIGFAVAAAEACGLEKVVFLPEQNPRGKDNTTGVGQRTLLLKDAMRSLEQLEVMMLGDERFTVAETLPALEKLFSGAQLRLLVGSDVVKTFPHRWPGLEILLQHVSLAVGLREGDTAHKIVAILARLEAQYGVTISYNIVRSDYAGLSSTQLRLRTYPKSSHPA